jgi:membrane protein
MKKWINILKDTYTEWSDDNCLQIGASFSFYTLASLVPLLLVIASLGTLFIQFTDAGQNLKEDVIVYIANAIGQGPDEQGNKSEFQVQLEQATAAREGQQSGSIISTVIGFGTLLFAASGIFGQLDEAMNTVFDVPKEARPQGVVGIIQSKLTAFAMVIGGALLLLIATLLNNFLTTIIQYLTLTPEWLFSLLITGVQFFIVAFVFGATFKYLPDIHVPWRPALVGGVVTSALWSLGQFVLSLYFANAGSFSSYGIIGAVLAFLFYIYYASQILFLGAEFTQVYARSLGVLPQPQVAGALPAGASGIVAGGGQAAGANGPTAVERALAEARKRELIRKEQELAQAQRQTRGAAASSGVIGLLAGVLLGGVALVTGVARSLGRMRRT